MFPLVAGLTGSLLIFFAACCSGSTLPDTHQYTFQIGPRIASVQLGPQPVKMINAYVLWPNSVNVPIVVSIKGKDPTEMILGRPAFGRFAKPGKSVSVTISARYFAKGESNASQSLSKDFTIGPDQRLTSGSADAELPLDHSHVLLLRVNVDRHGMASVDLRYPSRPAQNLRTLN